MDKNTNIDPRILEMIRLKKLRYYEAATGGAVLGGAMGALLAISYLLFPSGGGSGWFSLLEFVVMVWCIFFFTNRYGRLRGETGLNYPQGIGFILLMMIFTGIVYGVIVFFMVSVVAPDYYEAVFSSAADQLFEADDRKTELMQNLRQFRSDPTSVIVMSIFSTLLYGFFVGIIVAVFTKRAPANTNINQNETPES